MAFGELVKLALDKDISRLGINFLCPHNEQLDRGGDIHEPQRSFVLALLPAVEDRVDVDHLVDAGDQPGDVADEKHHHRGDEHDGQVQIPGLLIDPHLPHLH